MDNLLGNDTFNDELESLIDNLVLDDLERVSIAFLMHRYERYKRDFYAKKSIEEIRSYHNERF